MTPGKMHKGYYIRDKETGKQWRAPSGKTVWATPGAAKLAYIVSSRYGRTFDGKDRWGRPTIQFDKGGYEVLRFNDQDKFEIVELNSEASKAISLLRECFI